MIFLPHTNLTLVYLHSHNRYRKLYTLKNQFSMIFFCVFIIFTQMANTEENNTFFTSESCPIFTSKFYKATSEDVEGNIISSPISIHLLLSFLSHGAKGKTAMELIETLSIDKLNELPNEYKNLTTTLNTITNAELHVANSAYLHNDIELIPEFSTIGIDFYNFAVSTMNFNDSMKSAEEINSWIMEKTKKKITNMISSGDITDDTRMILVNAIYFKGSWKFPFEHRHTSDKPFYTKKDHQKLVPTMTKKLHYIHGDLPQLNSRFLEIPYKNEDLSMVIILPNEVEGLSSLEKNFNWNSLLKAEAKYQEVRIHLPKFKIESTLNLKTILNMIGIQTMFENTADFSGMTGVPVKVSKVIQKAFLEVNEEGCEAAAATLAQIRLRRMIEDPEEFIVDRPFMLAIRHKHSDIPLFIGRVKDIDVNTSLSSGQREEL